MVKKSVCGNQQKFTPLYLVSEWNTPTGLYLLGYSTQVTSKSRKEKKIMLSKLISAEKRTRTNGEEFYVCTFSYSQGAKDAPTFITIGGVKVLNPQAAAIRNINLVKCLFPTEDETAKAYKKNLDRFIKCMESDSKTFTTKKGEVVKLSDCEFSLPLVYKTLPVSEVLGVSKIYYADANGEQKELTQLNAVGYSRLEMIVDEKTGEITDYKDSNEWDNDLNGGTYIEVITRNANANIANGSYWYEKRVNKPEANESVGNPVSEPEKTQQTDDEDNDE